MFIRSGSRQARRQMVFGPEVIDHGLPAWQLNATLGSGQRASVDLINGDIVEQIRALRGWLPDMTFLVETGVIDGAEILLATAGLLGVMRLVQVSIVRQEFRAHTQLLRGEDARFQVLVGSCGTLSGP